jgi:ubiquinone/menaquinone biosynthesis C-methylase UbiE
VDSASSRKTKVKGVEALAYALDNRNAVRRQFSRHAEAYRQSRTHSDQTMIDHILELISPTGEEEGLDVGCGGGHMATAVAKNVRKLVAVDITPEMLVQTNKLAEEKELQNLRFCLADARALPFQSNIFDIVSCRIVLHHVSNAGQAVAEMGRVLKKGGCLFIQDILGFDDPRARSYMDDIERLRDPSHIKDYNMAEWTKFLVGGGMQMMHSEVVPGVYDLREWMLRSGTPGDRQEKIKRRLCNMPQAVEKHLTVSCAGGNWSIQMRYILLLSTKA